MIISRDIEDKILSILNWSSSITLLGPRQIGKTTLAKLIQKRINKTSLYIDLEDEDELNKIALNKLFFEENSDKCIIIDEVQRYPKIFSSLRSYIVFVRKLKKGKIIQNYKRQTYYKVF